MNARTPRESQHLELKVGKKLRVTYTTPGGENWRKYAKRRINVRHTKVISVIPGKEWSHRGRLPLLLSVTETFRLEQIAEKKTKLIHHGLFTGLATRFFSEEFFEGGRIGFEETVPALKKRIARTSVSRLNRSL